MNKPKAKGTDSLSQIQISNPSLQPADKNHGYFQGIYFNLKEKSYFEIFHVYEIGLQRYTDYKIKVCC